MPGRKGRFVRVLPAATISTCLSGYPDCCFLGQWDNVGSGRLFLYYARCWITLLRRTQASSIDRPHYRWPSGVMERLKYITRRQALFLSGAAALSFRMSGAHAVPPAPRMPIDFDMPPGACDCHVHVIGDPGLFPMASGRVYTPAPAGPDDLDDRRPAG